MNLKKSLAADLRRCASRAQMVKRKLIFIPPDQKVNAFSRSVAVCAFKSAKIRVDLRPAGVFRVHPNRFTQLVAAGLFLLFLAAGQGCSLLFVAKGNTSITSVKSEKAPDASSLAKEMDRADVIHYKVQPGDSLDFLASVYYGDPAAGKKLAKENRLKASSSLKPGRELRIVNPVYFPSPDQIQKKREQWAGRPAAGKAGMEASPTPVSAGSGAAVDAKNITRLPRAKVNKAFAPGEKLTFEIRALSIVAGYADLEVGSFTTVAGRPCYPLIARARAAFPFNTFYPVKDLQTSYFDSVDFITWKFQNDIHEGSYLSQNLEIYDQLKHKVVRKHNKEQAIERDVAPFTQDLISCFYYFRLLPVEEGKTYSVPTQSGGKNYQLVVRAVGREKVKVPAGTFDCLRMKPLIQEETIFHNKGDIDIWVTADQRHIPVLIRSAIVIGNIEATLLNASLPKVPGDGTQWTSRLSR